jgi:predicted acyltransferase
MAFFEAEGVMLPASNAKVLLIAFYPVLLALSIPAALLCGVGEGGEYALRLDRVIAFDDKRVVDHGLMVHECSPPLEIH